MVSKGLSQVVTFKAKPEREENANYVKRNVPGKGLIHSRALEAVWASCVLELAEKASLARGRVRGHRMAP